MLDVGWSEMAIVAVVALFVIGPKELPRVLRMIGRYTGKIKSIATGGCPKKCSTV